jgi:hypothetical protein
MFFGVARGVPSHRCWRIPARRAASAAAKPATEGRDVAWTAVNTLEQLLMASDVELEAAYSIVEGSMARFGVEMDDGGGTAVELLVRIGPGGSGPPVQFDCLLSTEKECFVVACRSTNIGRKGNDSFRSYEAANLPFIPPLAVRPVPTQCGR